MSEKELECGCGCGHNHEEHSDCGCGCGHEEEMETMFLTFDDDTEVECGVLGVFDVDGKEYIALLPITDETVLLYEYRETEDGIELDSIESDEEFNKVSEVFNSLVDAEDQE